MWCVLTYITRDFLCSFLYFIYFWLTGSYNKAFRLTFDDSIKVVARLPTPLAGPSYLVTASEVATLQFTREVLDIPVPRVLTWSGAKRNSINRVGADYIIMEEVAGVSLGFVGKSLCTPTM